MPPKKGSNKTKAVAQTAAATATAPTPARKEERGPPPAMETLYRHNKKSAWLLVALLGFYAAIASLTIFLHYQLPTPITLVASNASESSGQGALFSEEKALDIIHHLSNKIGYRIVGTREHVEAEDWFEAELRKFEGYHAGTNPDGTGGVQVEVFKQIADGAHRFDFMSSVVWKKYYGMSNLIVRISDGTGESKKDALLLNAHLDSTLPSPGAADDGAGVGILYEILRLFTTAPLPKLRHSVILLFNNGEESLQDASHLYITQHETAPTVRAVVNLEACGVSGPELLFQATSESMIHAYSKVPRPFGTVLANDIFSTGLILSDTDFRQFVQYGGLAGLDMAIVGGSYLYHTRLDVSENIEPGVVQHFGENVLAIVRHLVTSPDSKLKQTRTARRGTMPIYFSLANRFFFLIPSSFFKTLSMSLAAFSNFQLQAVSKMDRHFGMLTATAVSVLATLVSLVFAVVTCNGVALLMTRVLGHGMSWYTREWFPVVLYGPPALTALLAGQYWSAKIVKKANRPYMERASFNGLLITFIFGLLGLNAFGIGSAYLMALAVVSLVIGVTVNDFCFFGFQVLEERRVAVGDRVHPSIYFIVAAIPASIGAEGLVSFLDLFVPLTGRMGEISPADNIIGTIVAVLTFLCMPFVLPLSHRFGEAALRRTIVFGLAVSVVVIGIFASPAMSPFDKWHPKRLFVHQAQNITSGEWFMNLGSADPAPGFAKLVSEVHASLGIPGQAAELVEMNEYNSDFDILYPVSAFLTPYKFKMPTPPGAAAHPNFQVQAVDEVLDFKAGTRSLTLQIDHPGLIWSVVAFDADILEWDLPTPPPRGYQRHHIKEVSRYGTDRWTIRMLLKLDDAALARARARGQQKASYGELIRVDPSAAGADATASDRRDPSRLWIDFSGLDEKGRWPAGKERGFGQANIATFAKMDAMLLETHPEVDSMLLSIVAGVAVC